MATMLPIVEIKGKNYFQDNRLREFRAVHNPHDRITFDEQVFNLLKEADERYYLAEKQFYDDEHSGDFRERLNLGFSWSVRCVYSKK